MLVAGITGITGLVFSVHAQTYNNTDQTAPATTTTVPEQSQVVQPTPAPEQAQPMPPQEYEQPSRSSGEEKEDQEKKDLFHANEFSADIFAVGTFAQSSLSHNGGFSKKDEWGGGAGINYFLTKNLGIGGDFDVTSRQSPIVDTTTGNLIFRVPFEKLHLAPYIFGGAGYQFRGINQFVGGGGVGVEFRICEHIGIFCDGRYLAAKKTNGYAMGRLGVRFSF